MSVSATIEAPAKPARSHDERFITVEGTTVRYLEGGAGNPGPPLVLLHGYLAGANVWFPHTLPALAARRHVIAVDLPGFAHSGKLAQYSSAAYAHFVCAFLDALGCDQVDILGHSMGGQIAIAVASANPERVRRLVLVASSGLPRTEPGYVTPISMAIDRSAFHVRLYIPFIGMFARARATRACLRMIQDDSVHGKLSAIGAPTLIVWGSRDRVVPLEHATIFARAIPNARLYIMRGCGHMPFYQKHAQFENLVLHFLSK
jgi:pimeloyl-ACP methyl ester carboxylesterase